MLSRDPGRLAPPVTALAWDPLAGPPPPEALDGLDAVVHLAGEPIAGRWTPSRRKAILDSRATGTRHLVDGILASGEPPRVMISASATGYYGDRGEERLVETSEGGEGFLADVCRGWEREASRASEAGTRVVVARLGIVLGPGGGALERLLKIFRSGLGGRLGSGRQWWSWVHADDVAGALLHALETDVRGPVNVVSPGPVRQAEFARTLGSILDRPAVLPVPAPVLRIALGDFSSELLSSKHVLPASLQETGYAFLRPTLDEALLS
jgi:uncharacterized protein (TIGR01777 family)